MTAVMSVERERERERVRETRKLSLGEVGKSINRFSHELIVELHNRHSL